MMYLILIYSITNMTNDWIEIRTVEFVVNAFEADFPLENDFLKTPVVASSVPVGLYTGYESIEMNKNIYDRNISNSIGRWMGGRYGDGEEGIISRNDSLFSVYEHLARLGKFSRNKHEDSTVTTTRSDRTDKYEGVTLVKIEEKDDSLQEAIEDLQRKARWLPHYARLPFIFGIAVTSDQLEIFTLHEDGSMGKVFSAQLTDVVDRWSCVIAMINIARTLKRFIEQQLISRSVKFDVWHNRANKKIRLDINFVEVEFTENELFERMQLFYNRSSTVPNLEHLYVGPVGPYTVNKRRVRLVPVGVERRPETMLELIAAIKQIFNCLCCLHDLGYVHCDVRWSNIIVVFDNWFLIDCEYACSLTETSLLLTRSACTIKKRYVLDVSAPWSPLFDLFQIGMLLADINFDLNSDLVHLREYLLSRNFTAADVKRKVENLA